MIILKSVIFHTKDAYILLNNSENDFVELIFYNRSPSKLSSKKIQEYVCRSYWWNFGD